MSRKKFTLLQKSKSNIDCNWETVRVCVCFCECGSLTSRDNFALQGTANFSIILSLSVGCILPSLHVPKLTGLTENCLLLFNNKIRVKVNEYFKWK